MRRVHSSAAYHARGAVETALQSDHGPLEHAPVCHRGRDPDAALNILTNRWLVYQTLSCRFYARSAFYQSGGAFGFRDQLQDVLAFLHFDAGIARVTSCVPRAGSFPKATCSIGGTSRAGKGVRTRIQDDRLWLVYAALEYARVTGDWGVFNASAPLIVAARTEMQMSTACTKRRARRTRSCRFTNIARARSRGPWRRARMGCRSWAPAIGTTAWTRSAHRAGAKACGSAGFLASLLGPFAALAESRGHRPAGRRSIGRTSRG